MQPHWHYHSASKSYTITVQPHWHYPSASQSYTIPVQPACTIPVPASLTLSQCQRRSHYLSVTRARCPSVTLPETLSQCVWWNYRSSIPYHHQPRPPDRWAVGLCQNQPATAFTDIWPKKSKGPNWTESKGPQASSLSMTCLGLQGPARVPPVPLSQWDYVTCTSQFTLCTTIFEQMRSFTNSGCQQLQVFSFKNFFWVSTTSSKFCFLRKMVTIPVTTTAFDLRWLIESMLCILEKDMQEMLPNVVHYDPNVSYNDAVNAMFFGGMQDKCTTQWTRIPRNPKNHWQKNPFIKTKTPFIKIEASIRPWSEHDPNMIRAWSDHELVISHPPVRRGYFSRFGDAFCIENYNISRSGYLPKFHPILCLPRKMTLQHHQMLRLPRKVTLQDHQILLLPRKVALQDHQMLRLPQKVNCYWAVTQLSCYWTVTQLSCYWTVTELSCYWTVTDLSWTCYSSELLLNCYSSELLLNCYSTELNLLLKWAVTELLLKWAVTELLLNWAVTELLLNWAVTELLLNWAVTELLLNWAVIELLLNWAEPVTQVSRYWTVTQLSWTCYSSELLLNCYSSELLLNCYSTELLLNCYSTELNLLLNWAVTELLLKWAVIELSCYCIFKTS